MKQPSIYAIVIAAASTLSAPLSFAQASSTAVSERAASSAVLETKDIQEMKDLKQIRVSKLVGATIASQAGDNLGQVQDLVINPRTGQIQFALVSKGFMAGLGHSMIPVPWQAINVRSEREFALSVDKDKLRSAPDWSEAEMEQPDYMLRVYRFYEIEPQSGVGSPRSSGTESGEGHGSSSGKERRSGSAPESDTLRNHSSEATDKSDLSPEHQR